MIRHKLWIMIGLACVLLIPALHGLQAQNSTVMNYGEGQSGTITSDAILSFYTFEGVANDLVIARALGLTPGLRPAITLFSPTQQQLATSGGNLLGLNPSESRLAFRLPETGIYTLVVASADGTFGDFVLLLDGRTPISDEPLSDEAPAEILLPSGAPAQLFTFAANPDAPIVLNIAPETEDFSYSVEVYDPNGNLLAILGGLPNAALTIPAGDGLYLIAVQSLNQTQGTLFVSFNEGETPDSGSTGGQNLGGTGACTVLTGDSGVNVRSGPGLGYQVIGRLAAESSAPTVGANGGWYAITFNHSGGNVGWVGASVVLIRGACGNLPTLVSQPVVITATPTSTIAPDDDDDDDDDNATAEPTDEATDEPEETPEATDNPEETPEATGEATSEATAEATPEVTPEV